VGDASAGWRCDGIPTGSLTRFRLARLRRRVRRHGTGAGRSASAKLAIS
jgi:hypothetical protein